MAGILAERPFLRPFGGHDAGSPEGPGGQCPVNHAPTKIPLFKIRSFGLTRSPNPAAQLEHLLVFRSCYGHCGLRRRDRR